MTLVFISDCLQWVRVMRFLYDSYYTDKFKGGNHVSVSVDIEFPFSIAINRDLGEIERR